MNKNDKLIVLFFILAAVVFLIPGSRQAVSETVPQSYQFNEGETLEPRQIEYGQAAERTRAEQVMRAFAEAYPRQIERVEFRGGDWALLLRGTWYYYAEGKLLPENLLASAANYSPHYLFRPCLIRGLSRLDLPRL